MPSNESSVRELSSWKEIASYLGVSVRTAQGWERDRGLPVRRLPGRRGPVMTTVAELEVWKQSADGGPLSVAVPGSLVGEGTLAVVPKARPRRLPAVLGVLTAVALVALVAGVAAVGFSPARVPVGFRVEQNSLIIVDARGRELWRQAVADLSRGNYENDRFVRFVDLDGDGRTEVLIVPGFGRRDAVTPLICYAHDGVERWRFVPGRTVRTATETFAPPFRIQNFAVIRAGKQHAVRIVVTSQHYLYYPTQVALLAPDGKVLREYWHSGGLTRLVVPDEAGDGVSRIVLGGVHNASKDGTVVVLDPDTMAGASGEENPAYQLLGLSPGVEVARLLFPRSCMNELLEPFLTVGAVWRELGLINVELWHRLLPDNGASVFYQLNPDLSLKRMTVGSSFEASHQRLFATRVLDHAFSVAEEAGLRKITYLATSAGATK